MKQRKYTSGNFRLKVRRSRTGLGLFTEEPVAKGRCIIEYVGRQISREEEYTSKSKYLFAVHTKKIIDGRARANTARYINHSCRPNCEIEIRKGRVYVFSKRAIRTGEELLYDYGKEYFDEFIKPVGCRCAKCQGS